MPRLVAHLLLFRCFPGHWLHSCVKSVCNVAAALVPDQSRKRPRKHHSRSKEVSRSRWWPRNRCGRNEFSKPLTPDGCNFPMVATSSAGWKFHNVGMRPSRDKSGSTIRDFDLRPRQQCNDGYDKSGSHHPRFCWSISPFQRFSLVCYYLVTAAGAHSALPSMHDILTNLSIFSRVARSVYLVIMSAGFSVPRTLCRVTAPVRTFS